MTVTMDAEWTRRPASTSASLMVGNLLRFRRVCLAYGEGINRNYRAFCRANGEKATDHLERHYYNPVSYLPLSGAGDECAVVLVDDHESAQDLAIHAAARMEDVGLGYGVDPDSVADVGDRTILCRLDELLDGNLGPRAIRGRDGRDRRMLKRGFPFIHGFQRQMPFLVAARFRLAGLGAIGHGLACQQAVYRATAARIKEVIHCLRARQTAGRGDGLFCAGDLEFVKIALQDLQRPEEIGALIFCRNFSVATQIVFALRALRYRDLFKIDPEFEALLGDQARSPVHEFVLNGRGSRNRGGTSALCGRHVFRSTRSALLVSPHVALENENENCNGYVRSWLDIQVAPGHELDAQSKLTGGLAGRGALDSVPPKIHLVAMGPRDILIEERADALDGCEVRNGIPNGTGGEALTPITAVLRNFVRVRKVFRRKVAEEAERPGRDLVEAGRIVSVPVITARLFSEAPGKPKGGRSSMPLTDILDQIRTGLLRPSGGSGTRAGGGMDILELLADGRSAGLPRSLTRSMACLFQTFVTAVADPFLFDLVLDLYDVFASLKTLLKRLPQTVSAKQEKPRRSFAVEEEVALEISRQVAAMHNALSYRLAKAWPENSTCDMAIDFRGGQNQVLLAASAPMMCGMGVLRRYLERLGEPGSGRRDALGAVTCLSTAPGVRAHSLRVGKRGAPRLGYLEADVAHIFHVADYADYLHEACHFIFHALDERKSDGARKSYGEDGPVIASHINEIFALLLSHILIFESDRDGSFIHYFASFSRSAGSVGADEIDAMVRYVAFSVRHFFVFYTLDKGVGAKLYDWSNATEQGGATAWASFEAMLRRFGPYLSGYDGIFCGKNSGVAWEFARLQFLRCWSGIRRKMPSLVKDVETIVGCYRKAGVLPDGRMGMPDAGKLRGWLGRCFNEGRFVLRSYVWRSGKGGMATDSEGPDDPCLDALHLLGELLRQYILTIKGADNFRVHLEREAGRGRVKFCRGVRPWHRFLIENGRAAMFCAVPSARSERLLRQAVLMKTAWDISTSLRARRLWVLMQKYC